MIRWLLGTGKPQTLHHTFDDFCCICRNEKACAIRGACLADGLLEDFERVMSEECAADEHHCACVPHLRLELRRASSPKQTIG